MKRLRQPCCGARRAGAPRSVAQAARRQAARHLRRRHRGRQGGAVRRRRPASRCSSTAAIPGGRDTDRLMAAVTEAGLKQIDFLISTHYHVDHIGGMAELAKRIPVGTFIDHGPSVEEREQVQGFQASLRRDVRQGQAPRRQAGGQDADHRPRLANRDGRRQRAEDAAAGRRQAESRVRGVHAEGASPTIPTTLSRSAAWSRSASSASTDFGDLLWNKEHELMCPNNPDRHRGPVHGHAPRARSVELAGARARRAAARGGDAERHAQGSRRRRRCRRCGRRPGSRTSGSCTGATAPGSSRTAPGCSSPTSTTTRRLPAC